MNGTTKAPVKKAAAKKATAKKAAVAPVQAAAEAEPVDEAVQLKLDVEQKNFELATVQAQLNYLSARVADLVKENHKLAGGSK